MSACKTLLLSLLLFSCTPLRSMQEEAPPPAPPTIDQEFLAQLQTSARLYSKPHPTPKEKSEVSLWMLRLQDFYSFEESRKKKLLRLEHRKVLSFSDKDKAFIDARYQESQFLAPFFTQNPTRITKAFNRFVSPETGNYFTSIFKADHTPEQMAQEMHNLNVELLQKHLPNGDLSCKAAFGVAVYKWAEEIGKDHVNNAALLEKYENIALCSALAECVRRDYEKQCAQSKPSKPTPIIGALAGFFGNKK